MGTESEWVSAAGVDRNVNDGGRNLGIEWEMGTLVLEREGIGTGNPCIPANR